MPPKTQPTRSNQSTTSVTTHESSNAEANAFFAAKHYSQGLEKLIASYDLFLKSKDKTNLVLKYSYVMNLASHYYKLKNYPMALDYAKQALVFSVKYKFQDEPVRVLFQIYDAMEDEESLKKLYAKLSTYRLTNNCKAFIYGMLFESAACDGNLIFNIDDLFTKQMADFACANGYPKAKDDYEIALVNYHLREGNYKTAALSAVQLAARTSDLPTKMDALLKVAVAQQGLKEIKLAILYAEKVISLHKTGADESSKQLAADAGAALAKIYDNDDDKKYWDIEKALKYYQLSADLGHPASCHDLGYKYQNGEDVDQDLPLAMHYFKKAVAGGYEDSKLNICAIKIASSDEKERLEAIEELKKLTTIPELSANAHFQLGRHYWKACVKVNKSDLEQRISLGSLAQRYIEQALDVGDTLANIIKALMLFDGIGFKKDIALAIECLKHSGEKNAQDAKTLLLVMYPHLLIGENDPAVIEKYFAEYKQFCSDNSLPCDVETFDRLSAEKIEENSRIHSSILDDTYNFNVNIAARLDNLLQTPLQDMDSANLVTFIHKFGFLIDKSREGGKYCQANLDDISRFITKTNEYLHDTTPRFSVSQLILLAVGLSKLYLQAEVEIYKATIEKLFSIFADKMAEMTADNVATVIFTMTRLDKELEIVAPARELLKHVFKELQKLNDFSRVCLYYTTSMLNPDIAKYIPKSGYKLLVSTMVAYAAHPRNNAEADMLYLALQSWSTIKAFNPLIPCNVLDNLQQIICGYKSQGNQSHISALQKRVVNGLRKLIPNRRIQEEEMIGSYPVDAFVTYSSQQFILQVDGPKHYLYGLPQTQPKMHPRTELRNRLLELHSTVVCVPYWSVDVLKTQADIKRCLKVLLQAHGISVTAKSMASNQHALFAAKPSNLSIVAQADVDTCQQSNSP